MGVLICEFDFLVVLIWGFEKEMKGYVVLFKLISEGLIIVKEKEDRNVWLDIW